MPDATNTPITHPEPLSQLLGMAKSLGVEASSFLCSDERHDVLSEKSNAFYDKYIATRARDLDDLFFRLCHIIDMVEENEVMSGLLAETLLAATEDVAHLKHGPAWRSRRIGGAALFSSPRLPPENSLGLSKQSSRGQSV